MTAPTITIPTLREIQLGPYSQYKEGIGACGCFYYWENHILCDLTAGEQVRFKARAMLELRNATNGAPDSITCGLAANTLANRRIAYNALREAWRSLGYEEIG